jgi:hypothetical protein
MYAKLQEHSSGLPVEKAPTRRPWINFVRYGFL